MNPIPLNLVFEDQISESIMLKLVDDGSDLRTRYSLTPGFKPDREANYVFLYDHDGYYSKLKIVNWGGGVVGEPAWIEVQWYHNNTLLDNRF